MYVKNTGPKALGFGSLALLPGNSGNLSADYSETHPMVKFYFKKGWLEKAEKPAKPAKPVEVEPEADTDFDTDTEPDKSLKEISRLSLAALQEKATELEVDFDPADTRAVLIEKITAKVSAAE